jgi:multidrug efflux pump subunit AcrB
LAPLLRTQMLNPDEETVSGADRPPPPPPPEAKTLEIKLQPADAIGGPVPVKNSEKAPKQKTGSFFGRLMRFTMRTVAVVCLLGVAWAAGAFYSSGHLRLNFLKSSRAPDVQQTSAVQQTAAHDELLTTVQQMADEIRALKSSVDSKGLTQDAGVKTQEGQQNAAGSGPTMADLAGRVDKLEIEVTTKLSQVSEQLATIQQQMAASHVAAASRPVSHARRVEHLHDAFDPSREPGAPGAPRPLGSH